MTSTTDEPKAEAYAQRAIYRVMKSGEWYTVRQLSALAKVTDPRANIRTMIERGYIIEKRRETNNHGKSYKLYRLILQ